MLVGKKGGKTYQSGRGRLKFAVDFFPTEVQAPNCVGIFTFPAGDFLI